MNDLKLISKQMRRMSNILVPYTYPKNDPRLEDDISWMKTRSLDIDGYSVIISFNRADYEDYFLETFQIFGATTTFLPFHLVVKLAKIFLGTDKLSLVEIFKGYRKIYCWTVWLNKEGEPINAPNAKESETCEFEGLKYLYMSVDQFNLY